MSRGADAPLEIAAPTLMAARRRAPSRQNLVTSALFLRSPEGICLSRVRNGREVAWLLQCAAVKSQHVPENGSGTADFLAFFYQACFRVPSRAPWRILQKSA